jgi:hypothetical protein
MVGLARHTLGGMDIRVTRGMIGVGALVGVAILIIRDLSRHITTTTIILLTMAVCISLIVPLWQ